MIKTNLMTVDEALNIGNYKYEKAPNDINKFYGAVDDYVVAVMVEGVKENNGKNVYTYSNLCFTNDLENILFNEENGVKNELGNAVDQFIDEGYFPTGNLVFRGYFQDKWGMYTPSSKEVMKKVLENS